MEARCHSSEPFPRDNLDLSLIGFWISASCVTASAQIPCGMKHLNQMFPCKRWTWLLPPLIGEVTTNRRLSLVLGLFSALTPRVSQKGRLSSFRGNDAVKPCDQSPVLFARIDTKPVFQQGHKVTAEMSLSRNSPEAFVTRGKITQGRRENHKWPFPTSPVEGRVLF